MSSYSFVVVVADLEAGNRELPVPVFSTDARSDGRDTHTGRRGSSPRSSPPLPALRRRAALPPRHQDLRALLVVRPAVPARPRRHVALHDHHRPHPHPLRHRRGLLWLPPRDAAGHRRVLPHHRRAGAGHAARAAGDGAGAGLRGDAAAAGMSYPRLFTVDEYYRMGEVGILPEDASVELIEGQIVEASPIGPQHAACVTKLTMLLHRTLCETMVSTRNPVRPSKYSELQPDITVAHARADLYASAHPTAADVLFLVEVADASLTYDRHTKLPLFARSGIAEA